MAAAIAFLILELISPALFFICFVAGSVAAGVYSYFSPQEYYWQMGIFIVVTLVLLPLMRKIAKRITKPEPRKSNVDALLGKVGLVTRAIDPDLGGQVLVEDETWRATADKAINEKEKVRIVKITGTKVHVEHISEGKE